jgi:hypothetical protein
MNAEFPRFPDPYEHRSDVGTATVFLMVLLLIVAIGGMLFVGNFWVLAPIDASTLTSSALSIASGAAPTPVIPASRTPASNPAFTAPTPVPPLAGVTNNPPPSANATGPKPGAATAANPNLMQQVAEWKAERVKNRQDPNDYSAFRQHEVAIRAPDPGPVAFPGFKS